MYLNQVLQKFLLYTDDPRRWPGPTRDRAALVTSPWRPSSTTVSWSANWSTTCRTTPTSPADSRETNRHSCLLTKRPGPGSARNRPRFDIMVSEHD